MKMTLLLFIKLLSPFTHQYDKNFNYLTLLLGKIAFLKYYQTCFPTKKEMPEVPFEQKALLEIPPFLFYAISI